MNFERALQQTDWENMLTGSNVEANCKLFSTELQHLVEEFNRKVKNRKNKQYTSLVQ